MTHVVDASTLLAYLKEEPGGEVLLVKDCYFHLSIINLAEVFTKVAENGGEIEDVVAAVAQLPLRVRAFREAHAIEVARLRLPTKALGLSFGDRACLALGRLLALPVLTADRRMAEAEVGLDIRLIR